MGDTSAPAGAVVPTVKSEPSPSCPETLNEPPPQSISPMAEEEEVVDKDTMCPICMQIMKDAFLTACGHSFCYMCIFTHLRNKNDCPCCGDYLTTKHIFPNLLLNKLLKKTSVRHQIANAASPVEYLRLALELGCEVSVKELDGLLSLLVEKKRKVEQQKAETNMQILHDFLYCLRKQKLEEFNQIQTDLQCIKEDIYAVERHRRELYKTRERCLAKLRSLDDPTTAKPWPSLIDKHSNSNISSAPNVQGWIGSSETVSKKTDEKTHVSFHGLQTRDAYGGSDSQYATQSGVTTARKRRVHAQFNDLLEYYLQKRRGWTGQSHKDEERNSCAVSREGYHPALEDFQSVLTTFTQYSRLRVIAELRHGDLFHAANIVSSIEFDRDDELFATAGVSRRIKIFEFSSLVNEPRDVHYPLVEMPTRSKLSCLSWNKCTKNLIASSDYEGIVTVWDVTTSQSVMEYEEHEKRAWSVDFSCSDPSRLVSGSDDCKVLAEWILY